MTETAPDQEKDARWTEYMRLPDIAAAPRNPKRHAAGDIRNSISRFGVAELPTLDERTGRLVAGHGRLDQLTAARAADEQPPRYVRLDDDGEWLVPVSRGWSSDDDDTAAAYLVASNRLTIKGGWDRDELADMLTELNAVDPSLVLAAGFTDDDMAALLATPDTDPAGGGGGGQRLTGDDDIPDKLVDVVTRPGDLWHLGPHRIICADTTDPAAVARLLDGLAPVTMLHADPPYGMGKESDGIANDNLYGPRLDAFQSAWWAAWRPHWAGNGAAYIWGNAPDLWRWWYTGGLGDDTDLHVRNELVWDKDTVAGMASAEMHQYPTATERCLVIFRGEQHLDSGDVETWWEGHEPLRAWMREQCDAAGWTGKDLDRICGVNGMSSHWTGRSQFHIITEHQYDKLRAAAAGRAFTPTYAQLLGELFPGLADASRAQRAARQADIVARRTYFNNGHDAMTDVWRFGRVTGEDRFGHATPKPVAMVERALMSSSRPGDVVGVPFAGTGPEWIGGDHLGRIVVGAELTPAYVDIVCRRYQAHTGTTPVRVHPDGRREPVDFH